MLKPRFAKPAYVKLNQYYYDIALFINEHLTKANKRLLWLSKTKARQEDWKYVWVSNGKILTRNKEGSKAIWIKEEKDLELMKKRDV